MGFIYKNELSINCQGLGKPIKLCDPRLVVSFRMGKLIVG